mmetsp:Transcript_26119/g.90141  ORF Transcript_26119/g.90141 Transcript_26119/m.90141 type:complete len:217 (-) Transcript_26119:71-721(-)
MAARRIRWSERSIAARWARTQRLRGSSARRLDDGRVHDRLRNMSQSVEPRRELDDLLLALRLHVRRDLSPLQLAGEVRSLLGLEVCVRATTAPPRRARGAPSSSAPSSSTPSSSSSSAPARRLLQSRPRCRRRPSVRPPQRRRRRPARQRPRPRPRGPPRACLPARLAPRPCRLSEPPSRWPGESRATWRWRGRRAARRLHDPSLRLPRSFEISKT